MSRARDHFPIREEFWWETDPFLSVGGKEKGLSGRGPDAGPDWLRQFDAVLPGYTLKSQLDILSLLKQVGLGEKGQC